MSAARDMAIESIPQLRIRLRDGLIWVPQWNDRGVTYLVTRPEDDRTFQMGLSEYTLASLFDGQTTVAEAMSISARELGANAFEPHEAERIMQWLVDNRLAEFQGRTALAESTATIPKPAHQRPRDLFWFQIPLFNPERLLHQLDRLFGWFYSTAAILLWLPLWIVAAISLVGNGDELQLASVGILAPTNWISLLFAWIVLKILHELAHGVACTRLGGRISEAGIVLILLTPLAYVDASASTRFRSRWHRMIVALAGMHIEITVAACAIMIRSSLTDPVIRQWLLNTAFMAGVGTILFNANPLMKFDGYYILSDLLRLPNLSGRASLCLKSAVHRVLFGTPIPRPAVDRARSRQLMIFGILQFFWRVMICSTMAVAAATLFHGFGIIASVIGVFGWLSRPLKSLGRYIGQQYPLQPGRVIRAGILTTLLSGLIFAGMFAWQAPVRHHAVGIIRFQDQAVIRAETAGFIRQIFVADGQNVREGDPIMELENPRLQAEIKELIAQIDSSDLNLRSAVGRQDAAEARVERERRRSLTGQLSEKQRQAGLLFVRAPRDGLVIARSLGDRIGNYRQAGSELVTVASPAEKELRLLIPAMSAEDSPLASNRRIEFRTLTGPVCRGQLARLTPRARTKLSESGLAAVHGGPLAVYPRPRNRAGSDDQFELIHPHWQATVTLKPDDARRLHSGQRVFAVLDGKRRPLGLQAWDLLSQWIQSGMQQAPDQPAG